MARISTYPNDDRISLEDKWIGTDSVGITTKNFTVESLFVYFQQNLSIDVEDLVVIESLQDRLDELESEFILTSGNITGLSISSVIKSYVDTEISGINEITPEQETKIEEAHGWGNHALAGYLTSETDPTVPSHVKNITSTDVSEWDSAYTNMITGIDITENSDGSQKTVTLLRANAGSNLSDSFTDISETGQGGITDTNYYLNGASLDANGNLNLTVQGAADQSVNLDARYYTESEINSFNYIALTNLSVGPNATASGDGDVSYNNSTGVFTYTPPDFSGDYLPIAGGTMTGFIDFSTESIGLRGDIYNEDSTKILQNGSDSAEAWYKGRLIGDITDASLNLIYDSSTGSFHKDLYMYKDSDEEYDIVLGYTAQIDFTNDRTNPQSPIETLTAAKISTWDSLEPIANMYFFEEGSTDTFRLRLRKQTDSLSTNTSVLIKKGSYMTMSVDDDPNDNYTVSGTTIGALNIGLNYTGLQNQLDTIYARSSSVVSDITVNGISSMTGTVDFESGSGITVGKDGANSRLTFNFDNSSLGFITNAQETDPVFSASAASGITSTNITQWNNAYNKYTTGVQFVTGTGGAVSTRLLKRDNTTVTTADNITSSNGIVLTASSNDLNISADSNVLATKSYVDTNFALSSALPTAQEEQNWDTAYINVVTGLEFNTTTGVLTLQKTNGSDLTKNLDGRYLTTHPAVANVPANSNNSGNTFIQDIGFDTFGHVNSLATGTVTESDPVFSASAAGGIQSTDISEWDSAYSAKINSIDVDLTSGTDGGKVVLTRQDNTTLKSSSFDTRYLKVHPATAPQAATSVNNTGNTFIQDISFDSFGHVTAIDSVAVSGFLSLAANQTIVDGHIAVFDSAGDIEVSSISSVLPAGIVYTTGSPNFGSNTITAGDFILSSDRDLKENIIPLSDRKIDVDFKEYNFKGSKRTRFGVIAQDLEEKHPEFVHTRERGEKSVSYIDLLVAKVHELENRIKELESGSRNR